MVSMVKIVASENAD